MHGRYDTRHVFGAVFLRIGGREHDAGEVCAFGAAEIKFCLFDRRRVPSFQIIGQAERIAVDHVQLGIDPPRQLQSLDGGIGLSEPHEDVAAPSKAMGIVGIDRDRVVHLRLRLLVLLMENMDTAKNDVRTHI